MRELPKTTARARATSIALVAVLLGAPGLGCAPSLSDCARCRAGEVCTVGYRYCNDTVPLEVICQGSRFGCDPADAGCGLVACVERGMGPVYMGCATDDAGAVVARWCD